LSASRPPALAYFQQIPKAELHVHLEGSIQPATLLELARRNGVTLPADDAEGLRRWCRFQDFRHFVEIYITISRCLRRREDYELIAYEFGAAMARQRIRYAEVTFSPSTHEFTLGVPQAVYFAGLTAGRRRAKREFGVEIRWVFDIVRDASLPSRYAEYVTAVAIEGKQDGVVALGLGGLEAGNPPEPFSPWFERARGAGLHAAPHAGEIAGPESVWAAIDVLGAERIGHGVRAIDDPHLVARLAERQIALEVALTSNICLGVYRDMAAHPLRRLHEAGVPVVVNSDDPALFSTTLVDELALLPAAFRLGRTEVEQIVLNGVRFSFLPDDEKQRMAAEFRDGISRLAHEWA
jgi:adenosine deaminase